METAAFKLDIKARALLLADPSSSRFSNTVAITQKWEVEEFTVDESDDTVSSLGSYPDDSFRDPLPFLDFQNFTPDYVFQRINDFFHDHALSRLITDRILVESQRKRRVLPLGLGGLLFMVVSVKLTRKVYLAVPSSISTHSSQESQEEPESCAICLERMSESETNPICKLPGCTHEFHEKCVIQWLVRQHDSCPLCRQSVYGNGNTSQAMET